MQLTRIMVDKCDINANRSREIPILSRLFQEIGPQAFSTQVNNCEGHPDLHVNPIKPTAKYFID